VPSTWGAFPGRYVQILFLPFVSFYVEHGVQDQKEEIGMI
jgi:hypothetical protein